MGREAALSGLSVLSPVEHRSRIREADCVGSCIALTVAMHLARAIPQGSTPLVADN